MPYRISKYLVLCAVLSLTSEAICATKLQELEKKISQLEEKVRKLEEKIAPKLMCKPSCPESCTCGPECSCNPCTCGQPLVKKG